MYLQDTADYGARPQWKWL